MARSLAIVISAVLASVTVRADLAVESGPAARALRRELEAAYAKAIEKLRGAVRDTRSTKEKLLETLREVGVPVPAQLSAQDISVLRETLPLALDAITQPRDLLLVKLVRGGDRAGYIFRSRRETGRRLGLGIIKFARRGDQWRLVTIYRTSVEREKGLVAQQIDRLIASCPAFLSLHAERDLEPLLGNLGQPTATVQAFAAKMPSLTVNGVAVPAALADISSGRLLAVELGKDTPLGADPVFRGVFALRWGKNELRLRHKTEVVQLKVVPRGYSLPAIFIAVPQGKPSGELTTAFTIERKPSVLHLPVVASSLPQGSYGGVFVEGRLAQVQLRVNGRTGPGFSGGGEALVDGLRPGLNTIEVTSSLVDPIPRDRVGEPRQARLTFVLPGTRRVMTLPLAPREAKTTLSFVVK